MAVREIRLDLFERGRHEDQIARNVATLTQVDHLKMLEAESIFILREAAAESEGLSPDEAMAFSCPRRHRGQGRA